MPPRASTDRMATAQQEAILRAADSNYLGLFRIPLSQIKPHPFQCALCKEWVVELKEHLTEHGLDKAAHPVKVLLHGVEPTSLVGPEENEASAEQQQGERWVREDLRFQVFDGQHRLAACATMDTEEQWWFGKVYKQGLEDAHPAEFLSMIHTGNETEKRREAQDADRFLGVYRLQVLFAEGRITQSTLEVNKHRLMGTLASTRRGISNISKSAVLSRAVANFIEPLHLRDTFNAGTWRKLTAGRFYQLVAWILEEMTVQCALLLGNTTEVTSSPFSLPARQCRWENLEQGIRSKAHAWHKLEGGASAALERVKTIPENFRLRLSCAANPGWSFGAIVLLPSVLTSHIVLDPLQEMTAVGKHLIHMIAGSQGLDEYTSQHGQLDEDSHPVGYIYRTLGERARNSDGSLKDYPHKIIRHMWMNREGLLGDLSTYGIQEPTETSPEAYQILINQSKEWWALLRMFKMDRFPAGLAIAVPKEYGARAPSKSPEAAQPESSGSPRPPNSAHSEEQAAIQPSSLMTGVPTEQERRVDLAGLGGASGSEGNHSARGLSLELAPREAQPPMDTAPSSVQPPTSRHKRPREMSPEDDLDTWLQRSTKEARILQEMSDDPQPEAGHRRLNHQIHLLAERSRTLGRADAAAIALLMESLQEVRGPLLGRVTERLRRQIPRYKAKAEREAMAMYDEDISGEEEGEDEGGRGGKGQGGEETTSEGGDEKDDGDDDEHEEEVSN